MSVRGCVWNFQHGKFQKNAAFKALKIIELKSFFSFAKFFFLFLSGLTLLIWFVLIFSFFFFFWYLYVNYDYFIEAVLSRKRSKINLWKIPGFLKNHFYPECQPNFIIFSVNFLWIDELLLILFLFLLDGLLKWFLLNWF